MKTGGAAVMVVGLMAGLLLAAAPGAGAADGAGATAPGSAPTLLVKLAPGRPLPQAARPVAGWLEVPVPPGETAAVALARWRAAEGVLAAEQNGVLSAAPRPPTPVTGGADGHDPLAHLQWHLDRTQAAAARATAPGAGAGVTVAVLDTGVSAGPDLACHAFGAEFDAIRRLAGPGSAADHHGHGTHVAGTVAQCTGNGVGVAGMAPGVTLLPVRVLDADGTGTFATVAAGIDWAAAHGADVVNLSLGGECARPYPACRSLVVDEAIRRAVDGGVIVVAAAGNAASPYLAYPANHPDVIAVGATGPSGAVTHYSNGGAGLDLVAPGGVTADAGVVQESFSGDRWGYWARTGTSFAAPHVAGAAALLRATDPHAPAGAIRTALTCTAATAGGGSDGRAGHGELRAAAAVEALASGRPDPRPPDWPAGAALVASPAGRGKLRLSWPAARDCDAVAAYRVLRDGERIARVDGSTTSVVIPAGSGVLTVEAVDRSGNLAPGPGWDGSVAGDSAGLVDPARGIWHLRQGGAATSFYFGDPGDTPFMGDWDCDGVDTPGLYRGRDGFVYLRNTNTPGIADVRFYFGNPGDVPLAGDFDGDGCDTVSLYRPAAARVYVINRLGNEGSGLGTADRAFTLGDPGDVALVLDADGDGIDGVALHRPATGEVFVRHRLGSGPADQRLVMGDPGDVVVAGDWDGDGRAELAVWRPSAARFLGGAIGAAPWGEPGWLPVAGRFWR